MPPTPPLEAALGGEDREKTGDRRMMNTTSQAQPQATSGPMPGSPSSPRTVPKSQIASPGKSLRTAVDGDCLLNALEVVIGHYPTKEELFDLDQMHRWAGETADGIGAELGERRWFLDGHDPTAKSAFLTALRATGWEATAISRQRYPHDPGCFGVCDWIDEWGQLEEDTPLLVSVVCRRVWERLQEARRIRPDPWLGVVGYAELIPELPGNDLEIKFFDLEADCSAHRVQLARIFKLHSPRLPN